MVKAEKLHNDKAEDKSTKGQVESILAELRKGKKEANTTTNTSNKSSSTYSALTDKVILVNNSDEGNSSIVSAIT